MAQIRVLQYTAEQINATPYSIGQILYCIDNGVIYFDNVDGSRGITTSIVAVESESAKEAVMNPDINKLYLVRSSSKVYRYAGGWVEVVDTHEVVDVLYEAGRLTPVTMTRGTQDLAPTTLASIVYTADGLSVEAILASLMQTSLKANRLEFKIEKVAATQDNQTEFNIPFPTVRYLEDNNGLLIFVGSVLLDDAFYTINSSTLSLVANYNIEEGMEITYAFMYNTNDKPISSEYINGINIAPYSIPTSRLQSITDSIGISSSNIVASAKSVYNLSQRLSSIIEKGQPVISNKMVMTTAYVNATTNNQTEFVIPFPFEKYMVYGNNFLLFIGTAFIDDRRYSVIDNMIILDEGIDSGRSLTFVFLYNAACGNGAINPDTSAATKSIVRFREIAINNSWKAITYGKGLFVAVSDELSQNYKVMTSPDGENWTYRNGVSGVRWQSITYGDGTFVAVGKNQENRNCVMTSTDGKNWSSKTSTDNTTEWVSVAYGNGTFVAVAEQSTTANRKIMISPNRGESWIEVRSPIIAPLTKVVYGNGLFVALSETCVLVSNNGINWSVRSIEMTDLAYSTGRFYFLNTVSASESYFGNTEDFVSSNVDRVSGKTAISITAAGEDILVLCDRQGSSNNIILTDGYTNSYDVIRDSEYEYNKYQFVYGNGLMIGVKPQSDKVIVSGSALIPELSMVLSAM